MSEIDVQLRDRIREIVADIVEVDVDDVGWTTDFWNDLGADSLQRIEILSALERRFGITVQRDLVAELNDVERTYAVVVDALAAARS